MLSVYSSFLQFSPPNPPTLSPATINKCGSSASCTIGEFLFDDEYTPIATASCDLTSRYPNGTVFLNGVSLSGTSDGWYGYDLDTTGESEGFYRSQICCTHESEYLCIDKSYIISQTNLTAQEVEDAILDAQLTDHTDAGSAGDALSNTSTLVSSDIESAVWDADLLNFSNAGSFGNFVQGITNITAGEIWSNSVRSLTTFGTLVTDIWENDERTLTEDVSADISNLATKNDIDDVQTDIGNQTTTIEGDINTQTSTLLSNLSGSDTQELNQILNQLAQTRVLIESISNETIIQSNSSTEFNYSDLETRLQLARDYLNQIYADTQQVISLLGFLDVNWDGLTNAQIMEQLNTILATLGNDPNSPDYNSTLLYQLSWFNQSWPNSTTNNSYQSTNEAMTLVNQALNAIDTNNKSASTYTQIQNALTAIQSSESSIGNISSATSDKTLFGLVKLLEKWSEAFVSTDQQLSNLLANWQDYELSELESQYNGFATTILDINQIPTGRTMLENDATQANENLKNKAIALRALINLNQKFLSNTGNSTIETIWIETIDDNIVFRSAVYNPSIETAQTHDLDYFLPREATEEDIIGKDGIEVEYDTTQSLLRAISSISLQPQKLAQQNLTTKDIWTIPDSTIDSLKNQANELLIVLEDTSYYAQGTTLKNDIDSGLTEIQESQNSSTSPLDRIQNYRQNLLKLVTVQENMAKLQDLVTQANATGTITGFIGGANTMAVWGIVLIVIAGFVFMTIYMKKLMHNEALVHGHPAKKGTAHASTIALPITLPFRTDTARSRTVSKSKTKSGAQKSTSKSAIHSRYFHLAVIALSATILALIIGSSALNSDSAPAIYKADTTSMPTAPTAAPVPESNQTAAIHTVSVPQVLGTSGTLVTITVPKNQTTIVYSSPDIDSVPIIELAKPVPALQTDQTTHWAQIQLVIDEQHLEGWLHQDYIEIE